MTKDREVDRERGDMTVGEAGHLGGVKGGHRGGQRVKELIEEGREREAEQGRARHERPDSSGSDRH